MNPITNGWYKATRQIPLYTGTITSPTSANTNIGVGGKFLYSGIHNANWYQVSSASGMKFFINVDSFTAATSIQNPSATKPSPSATKPTKATATHSADGTTSTLLTTTAPSPNVNAVSIVFSSIGLAAGLYFAHHKKCKPLGYVGYGALGAMSFGIVAEIGVNIFQK